MGNMNNMLSMSSTWISQSVMDSREVIERYVNDPLIPINAFFGMNATYNTNCEVHLTKDDLTNFAFDTRVVYYGYLYSTASLLDTLRLSLGNQFHYYLTFDSTSGSGVKPGSYPVIFNEVSAPPGTECTFIGYRFNVSFPLQSRPAFRMHQTYNGTFYAYVTSENNTVPSWSVNGNPNTTDRSWKFDPDFNVPSVGDYGFSISQPTSATVYLDESPQGIFCNYLESVYIDYIEIYDYSSIEYIDLNYQNLSGDNVSEILVNLDKKSKAPNGEIYLYQDYPVTLTAAGEAAKQSLIDKGWFIQTN